MIDKRFLILFSVLISNISIGYTAEAPNSTKTNLIPLTQDFLCQVADGAAAFASAKITGFKEGSLVFQATKDSTEEEKNKNIISRIFLLSTQIPQRYVKNQEKDGSKSSASAAEQYAFILKEFKYLKFLARAMDLNKTSLDHTEKILRVSQYLTKLEDNFKRMSIGLPIMISIASIGVYKKWGAKPLDSFLKRKGFSAKSRKVGVVLGGILSGAIGALAGIATSFLVQEIYFSFNKSFKPLLKTRKDLLDYLPNYLKEKHRIEVRSSSFF